MNQQKENLEKQTPAKYFVERGMDVREAIKAMPIVGPFTREILGRIIAEVFKRFKTTETSKLLDSMKDLKVFSIRRSLGLPLQLQTS